MKIVNSFDVTFSLNEGIYKIYTKPNNEIKYIQKDSNHLPSVFGQTPLSFNEKKFQGAVPSYKKHCKILAIDTRSPITRGPT